ncbi:hypothetical protein VNO77_42044 [Canavalia gladiata]|uniref:RRM domain-containing protein n=1 Tax=Canavalia gladiata TaxID=3824 RepID=A0AAN9K3E1_CANGL
MPTLGKNDVAIHDCWFLSSRTPWNFAFILLKSWIWQALELDNTELLRHHIKVGITPKRGEHTLNRRRVKEFSPSKVERVQSTVKKKLREKPPKVIGKVENLFEDCGEIVDVRLHTDHEGRLNGFGHVEFATGEALQKALELDNTELLRRPISVKLARGKGEYTCNRSNWHNSFEKSERIQSLTVFVKGFDTSLAEEEIKASLEEHFHSCGELTKISIPTFRESGAVKGFAHLDFKDIDSVKKALHLDQAELGGYPLSVEKAKPRRDNHGIGSGRVGGILHFTDEGTGTV